MSYLLFQAPSGLGYPPSAITALLACRVPRVLWNPAHILKQSVVESLTLLEAFNGFFGLLTQNCSSLHIHLTRTSPASLIHSPGKEKQTYYWVRATLAIHHSQATNVLDEQAVRKRLHKSPHSLAGSSEYINTGGGEQLQANFMMKPPTISEVQNNTANASFQF